jgi:hypothetical protein
MINAKELQVGVVYGCGLGWRRIITRIIDGDNVEYAVENTLSFMPFTTTREDFAKWVNGEIKGE